MDLVDVYQGYASASLYGSFVAYIGIDPSSAKQRREKPTQSSILLIAMLIRSAQWTLQSATRHALSISTLSFETIHHLSKLRRSGRLIITSTNCIHSLPQPCIDSLRNLHESMLNYCLPRLSLGAADDETSLLDHSLLDTWSHLRTLGRWLNINGMSSCRDAAVEKADCFFCLVRQASPRDWQTAVPPTTLTNW